MLKEQKMACFVTQVAAQMHKPSFRTILQAAVHLNYLLFLHSYCLMITVLQCILYFLCVYVMHVYSPVRPVVS